MRTSFAVAAVAAAASTLVSASPVKLAPAPVLVKRTQAANYTDIDSTILNYALTLEHLEATFYKQGLTAYSEADFEAAGYPQWVRRRVTEIAYDEATHVSFLTSALEAGGYNATAACTYKFPDTDAKSFLAVAQILEGVGVSAYLGAASLITNPAYVTAAGAILTVEARHNTWIRSAALHQDGFPAPFDTPLGFNEVYTQASAFITACPASNPTLHVKAFPTLTLATTGDIKNGQQIKLTYPGWSSSSGVYATFLSALGQYTVPYDSKTGMVTVPQNINGQLYVVLTASNETVTDTNILAGPAVVAVDLMAINFSY